MEDKTGEENMEVIVIDVTVTIEVGIDQEKGHCQEFIVVIEPEVQAVVGLGQGPEPVLIGVEKDAIIVESMTILQGIVPPQEKREI